MTETEIDMLAKTIKLFVDKEVAAASGALQSKIDALETKIGDLQKRKVPEYKGVWVDDTHYLAASMVTSAGSLWIAKRDTVDAPGSSVDWQLCVKRGKDGRDARA